MPDDDKAKKHPISELAELREKVASFEAAETARERAEVALAEREERYRTVFEMMSDWVYTIRLDPTGEVVREWTTEAYVRVSGYTSEELDALGGWVNVVHPEDKPIMQKRVEALRAAKSDISEYRIITKSGEVRWLRDHGRPAPHNGHSRGVRVYGAAQDITEHKQLEEARRLTDRMEAIRELAVAIKHEVRNALTTIVAKSQLLALDSSLLTEDQKATALGIYGLRCSLARTSRKSRALRMHPSRPIREVPKWWIWVRPPCGTDHRLLTADCCR